MKKHIAVIGAGFGGMSAAAYLAKAGYDVSVYEKNSLPGGRAQVLKEKGFTFDMGPSWYMMPDVFDEFFADFGKKVSDYVTLKTLDPAYQVITGNGSFEVESYPEVKKLIKQRDKASLERFERFYAKSKLDYEVVRKHVLEKPMTSLKDVVDPKVLKLLLSSNTLLSYHQRINRTVNDPDIRKMMEFMSVFMGGRPDNIPAMYTLLAYVDLGLGVRYPMGGFGELAQAFLKIGQEHGAAYQFNSEVSKVLVKDGSVDAIVAGGKKVAVDGVVANADYHHVETSLLPASSRSSSASYWRQRTISPSGVLVFLGINRRVPNLLHHNLFFDGDWNGHFKSIARRGKLPSDPLFYASVPSKTDKSVAPRGQENIFVLVPVANGPQASSTQVREIVKNVVARLEKKSGVELKKHIAVKETAGQAFFKTKFNAYKGNAFGLAHTLRQSAVFRPKITSRKINNLWYTGQYTNPGTGVPMVVISGRVAAKQVQKVMTA